MSDMHPYGGICADMVKDVRIWWGMGRNVVGVDYTPCVYRYAPIRPSLRARVFHHPRDVRCSHERALCSDEQRRRDESGQR